MVFGKAIFSIKAGKITNFFLIFFSVLSLFIYIETRSITTAVDFWLMFISEVLFVNIVSLFITNLLEKINIQAGTIFIFFYCASPIAIISMCCNGFPNELICSNCFISFVALMLISKYSISVVMSKELKNISILNQLFLLFILMTGSIFSFANFNYSINIFLDNISSDIKIMDYIFFYSGMFTFKYDSLVMQIGIDKLLASISMVYSYFFISIVFATIANRLNSKNK